MARKTAKYRAARDWALFNGMQDIPSDADRLYKRLAEMGISWDGKSKDWTRTNRPVRADGTKSESMFSTENNTASGIYRLRVMGHPDDIDRVIQLLYEHLTIIETSEPYENRKGDGVRVYCTGKLTQTYVRGRRAGRK